MKVPVSTALRLAVVFSAHLNQHLIVSPHLSPHCHLTRLVGRQVLIQMGIDSALETEPIVGSGHFSASGCSFVRLWCIIYIWECKDL